MLARYPIFVDVSTLPILLVGGGAVAARKAASMLDAGARHVRAVATLFVDAFPAGVSKTIKPYEANDLAEARLVFAATDSQAVNDAVVTDARARGILVNRADASDALAGDFATAATFVSGPVGVAVSAGSAALSGRVRDGLAARFDPVWATMAEAMATLRPLLRDRSGLSPAERAAVFRDLAGDDAFAVLAHQDVDGLLRWLRDRHPAMAAESI